MTRSTFSLVAILAVMAPAALAESVSTEMRVSVQVIARAKVTVASQPSDVNVTEADVARGFVDLATPIVVQARTNSRRGYRLQAANTGSGFSSIELAFGESSMSVTGEGWISRPYIPGGETVVVNARLRLAPGSAPGRYPLPLVLSASPL